MKIRPPTNALGRIGKIRLDRDTIWFAVWGLALLAVEFSGPLEAHDGADLLRIIGLGALAYVTRKAHRSDPLQIGHATSRVLSSVARLYKMIFFEVGVDLREAPPIPGRIPRRCFVIPMLFLAAVLVGHTFGDALPFVYQDLFVPHPYIVNLLGLSVLWAVLLAVTLVMSFLVLATLHDGLVLRHTGQNERSTWPEVIVAVGAIGVIAFAGFLLPLWFATAIIVAAVAIDIAILAIPGGPRLTLLWLRDPGNESQVQSMDWRVLVLVFYASLGLFLVGLIMLACGGDVLPWGPTSSDRESMPVTRFLGVGMAWCSAAGVAFYSLRHIRIVLTARNDNPSIPRLRNLVVRGRLSRETQEKLVDDLKAPGWRPRFEGESFSDKQAVEIDLIEDDDLVQGQAPLAWPPCFSVSQLLQPKKLDELAQSHALRCRRNLVRGLERVFKKSARRQFNFGTGFYVAPHLWWVPALQRDDDEEEADLEEGTLFDEHVGPYFNRVMSLASRHHFFRVMEGLELDIIFVEDGVKWRKFRRVLRRLFELYDSHGGAVKAEDHHFSCAQGTRVLIHDHMLDNPFESDVYPEPDYAGLGRARVLHVYRDRGGHEDESPLDAIPEREIEPLWV